MTAKHWFLTLWLIAPLAAVALLCAIIALYPPRFFAKPVGAGAGYTGGANALGNILSGRPANADALKGLESHKPAPETPAGESTVVPAGDLVEPESLPQGMIFVVDDKARLATLASPIYLAGNFTSWSAGNEKYKLTPQSDTKWRIELPQPDGWQGGKTGTKLAFKFTRGDWKLEELQADMTPPGNRQLPRIDASKLKAGEKPVFEFTVPHWGDEKPENKKQAADDPYAPKAVTGTVRRLQITGGAGGAEGMARECLVWLPAGYDAPENAAKKYPVLYMHDAQNLFAKHAGIGAEWAMDETATKLIAGGKVAPFVIVGIPHGDKARMSEYLPANAIPAMAKPAGEAYVAFLLREIKPRVERAFRVETNPAKVAIGGSSLGAAIAVHAACEHPDQFGMVLAESLPLRTGDAQAWRGWMAGLKGAGKALPHRLWFGIGGKETGDGPNKAVLNKGYVDAVHELMDTLSKSGKELGGADSMNLVTDDNAQHNEAAWAERLPKALEFLFGN